MNLKSAVAAAKKAAKKAKTEMFVVRAYVNSYEVATEYDLDTFYMGSLVAYAVFPDGTVES